MRRHAVTLDSIGSVKNKPRSLELVLLCPQASAVGPDDRTADRQSHAHAVVFSWRRKVRISCEVLDPGAAFSVAQYVHLGAIDEHPATRSRQNSWRSRCCPARGRMTSGPLASELLSGPHFAADGFFAIAFDIEEQIGREHPEVGRLKREAGRDRCEKSRSILA
jgi:hypothetical protein